jgi:hypothetical protein
MSSVEDERGRAQKRIDAAVVGLRYSPYLKVYGVELQERLKQASQCGGIEGIHRALDEFDSLFITDDAIRARYVLLAFLVSHPEVAELGLEIQPVNRPGRGV